jgi:hypothetical protein
MKTIAMIVNILFLIGVSTGCIFFTRNIQRYSIRNIERGIIASRMEAYIRSDRYITDVRACGFIALIMSCFATYALFKSK